MYSKTGTKIKERASSAAFWGILSCILIGVILFVFALDQGFSPSNQMTIPPYVLIVLLVFAPILAIFGSMYFWQKYLLLAGYGELIEETAKASAHLEDIKNILSKNQTENQVESQIEDRVEKNNTENSVKVSRSEKKIFNCNGKYLCSYCGYITDVICSRLCPDCFALLENGTIIECTKCNSFYHKDSKCNCKDVLTHRFMG